MSIARVLYHTNSLLFLFDNPQGYSHVRVAREVHERAFLNLLRGKTRVVVNNCYDFVSTCDRVMLMQHAVVAANGQYAAPMKESEAFFSNMDEFEGVRLRRRSSSSSSEAPLPTVCSSLRQILVCSSCYGSSATRLLGNLLGLTALHGRWSSRSSGRV